MSPGHDRPPTAARRATDSLIETVDADRRPAGDVRRTPDPHGAIDGDAGAGWGDFAPGADFEVKDAREGIGIDGRCLRLVEPGGFAPFATGRGPEGSVDRIADHVGLPRCTPTKTRVSVFSS